MSCYATIRCRYATLRLIFHAYAAITPRDDAAMPPLMLYFAALLLRLFFDAD